MPGEQTKPPRLTRIIPVTAETMERLHAAARAETLVKVEFANAGFGKGSGIETAIGTLISVVDNRSITIMNSFGEERTIDFLRPGLAVRAVYDMATGECLLNNGFNIPSSFGHVNSASLHEFRTKTYGYDIAARLRAEDAQRDGLNGAANGEKRG